MNNFQALNKPEKPIEIWSPPSSPQAFENFFTPKFTEKESFKWQSEKIIEKLSLENFQLQSQIAELNNELKLSRISHQIEIRKINEKVKKKQKTVQEKFEEAQFESKVFPLTKKCSDKIEYVLNILKDFSHVNQEIEAELKKKESLEEEQCNRMSLIQDEGEVLGLVLSGNEKDSEKNYEKNEKNTEKDDQGNPEEIIKLKNKEIRKHKNFIKTLKASLENILTEHTKSKLENQKHLQEIADLKEKLASRS